MVKFRIEKDSLGTVKVENSKLWGAQTQRSIKNFDIGVGKFHFQQIFIEALAFKKNHVHSQTKNSNYYLKNILL